MGTHCSIAVQHADGSVSAVCCHFDGYIQGVGNALLVKHDSLELAEKLVSVGDMLSMTRGVVPYSSPNLQSWKDARPRRYLDLQDYRRYVPEDICDNGYRYIFYEGEWHVWGMNGGTCFDMAKVEVMLGQERPLFV